MRRSRHAVPASRRQRDEPCRMAAWRVHTARPGVPRSFGETHPGRASPFGTARSNLDENRPRRCRYWTGHRARNRHSRLEARRHDGPCLAAGLNVSLGGQQRISRFNRASCQTQFLGQRACRGNAVTRLQHSAGNRAAKPIVDLAIKRFGRRWIQRRDFADLCDGHQLLTSSVHVVLVEVRTAPAKRSTSSTHKEFLLTLSNTEGCHLLRKN